MTDVHHIIATTLGIPPERVTADLEFGSLPQWDSLNHVNLMLALERALRTEIDADLMVELTSVRAIDDFAAKRASAP